MNFIESIPGLADDTDLFITSDHGFSTRIASSMNPSPEDRTSSHSKAASKSRRRVPPE
jgi:hypothetical protein